MWLTNSPEAAKRLRDIDRKYRKAFEAARSLPFAAKRDALQKAKDDHQAAIDEMRREMENA